MSIYSIIIFFHLSVGNMFVTYVRNRPYCVIYLEKSGKIFDNRKKVNLPLIEIWDYALLAAKLWGEDMF